MNAQPFTPSDGLVLILSRVIVEVKRIYETTGVRPTRAPGLRILGLVRLVAQHVNDRPATGLLFGG